ncbi:Dynein cytoplasmic 1 intermediate chain 2a [Dissostichus eleginoides]|uniref:Dynein cytoplasmic 1 intermediate chain 2a n=1 Tax=Dissostichus eleginoides TaxID=100907 RepID=A0AAD9CJR0_DISEL|nr:Dynein cytoplasmic 1 intermediate chain 2a [Dissostichus eleginoides]
MSDKSELKAELERKKQRLAQIREEKKRKEEERKKQAADQLKDAANHQDDTDLEKKRRETEAMLQIPPPISPTPKSAGTPSEAGSQDSDGAVGPRRGTPKLGMAKVTQVDFPPRETVSYTKETQTPVEATARHSQGQRAAALEGAAAVPRLLLTEGFPTVDCSGCLTRERADEHGRDSLKDRRSLSRGSQAENLCAIPMPPLKSKDNPSITICFCTMLSSGRTNGTGPCSCSTPSALLPCGLEGGNLPLGHRGNSYTDIEAAVETQTEKPDQKEEEEAAPHELTEEEKLQILHSEDFANFFDQSTRIIERALSEHVDLFFDYSGRDLEEKEGQFMDERWSKHRVVTCLDWSLQYPELLLASYNNNEEAPHEPDGVALVWNMKYKKATPEYVFHCQSAVMSAAFAKFHPNVVVGGTYSGQIVLWDNRSNKRTPVQRTPLSAAAHTHPVYCVNVVGTQNAHNLISISTDGKICSWSLDMLSQPQDSMELVFKQSKAVAVTSMSFPLGDVNNFAVGSEDGSVYMSCRHGSKAGISEMFEGHQGPITGIDCHTAAGPLDFSHLFVTSSFDWTVKLWSTKNNKPLYSFEDNSDYVYDVMWSPTHPALFACVDGVGHLDLWNLNNDTEVPTASVTVEGNPALNRLRWAHSGKEIAVGDSDGRVLVYDVGEQTAVPRSDEWTRFVRTLAEINENRDDAEELAAQRLAA